MKLLNTLSFKLILALGLLPIQMFAQDKGGNGGGAFICTENSKSEILDLFEARLAGMKIKTSTDSVQKQIDEALKRLNPNSNLYKKNDCNIISSAIRKKNSATRRV